MIAKKENAAMEEHYVPETPAQTVKYVLDNESTPETRKTVAKQNAREQRELSKLHFEAGQADQGSYKLLLAEAYEAEANK